MQFTIQTCAERLEECQSRTLLDQSRSNNTCIRSIVSSQDVTQVFEVKDLKRYSDFRESVPTGALRSSRSIIVSLSSKNSYGPLRITMEDLQQLTIDEQIDASFAAVVASFGQLPRYSEQGYACVASNRQSDGSFFLSYLLRFAEKDQDGHWKIRQLGVYHSFCKATNSHFWLLLQSHPWDKDTLSKKLTRLLDSSDGRQQFQHCPTTLHDLILDTYVSQWRWYLDFLGDAYGDLSHYISTVEFRPDLGFGLTLETLQKCKRLLEEMAAVPALLDAVLRILSLVEVMRPTSVPGGRQGPTAAYGPLVNDMKSSIEVMMRQTQGVFELLGSTLDLKNQQDAAQVNQNLLNLTIRTAKDSAAIRVITLVTLCYLPANFVATLFGMNFFEFDDRTKDIIISHDIWIYFVAFALLTSATLLLWRIWMRYTSRGRKTDVAEPADEKV